MLIIEEFVKTECFEMKWMSQTAILPKIISTELGFRTDENATVITNLFSDRAVS